MRAALLTAGVLGTSLISVTPTPAYACGGLFCNATQPVVQSGEHIVFAVDDAAGTVRAIINIQYTGAAPEFAWILPLQAAPSRLAVGPVSLFNTIDRLIGPQFIVNRGNDIGQCPQFPRSGSLDAGAPADSGVAGVAILGQQAVGPYDSVVLASADPEAARGWLTENGYNVTEEMIRLVVPYLQKGDVLLALKLRNGQGVEDIQPVDVTMAGTLACVPIRLTAIAALDDLELRITMLSPAGRAIPSNYRHLELNYLALDWTNPAAFYSALVSRAADEAGGNAFVTEYAGPSEVFAGQIAPDTYRRSDLELTEQIDDYLYALQAQGLLRRDTVAIVADFISDEIFAAVGVSRGAFLAGQVFPPQFDGQAIDGAAATAAIWAAVVEPEQSAQALFDAYPRVTRLYTLLSPAEMTVDPELSVQVGLPDVSNLHRATVQQVCEDGAPVGSRITLAGGAEVLDYDPRGGTQTWQRGLPAAKKVEQLWDGVVIADRSKEIASALAERNRTEPLTRLAESRDREGCGCTANEGGAGAWTWALLVGLGTLGRRRRS